MKILDVCCGSRMFYYDKESPLVTYMDIREGEVELSDGRKITVKPDIVGDFRAIPFYNETYDMVVFDPPHLLRAGKSSWLAKKYGVLNKDTWESDIRVGFYECFRVLKKGGVYMTLFYAMALGALLYAGIAKFLFNLIKHWEEARNDG